MYLTTTGTVVAQLTRKGRQILAENSAAFNITAFKFSDDEINYAFFDGSTVDATNPELSNWPILEGCSNGEYYAGQRYSVFSADNTLVSLAELDTDIGYKMSDIGKGDKFSDILDFFYTESTTPAQRAGSASLGEGQRVERVGLGTNLGGAPFQTGQQDLRPDRSSAEVFIEYDSAQPGQEWSFKVKTFYGNDNSYIVSFPSSKRVFTVNGSYQTVFNSIPDTDPTQTFQNQTEATITFKLAGDFIAVEQEEIAQVQQSTAQVSTARVDEENPVIPRTPISAPDGTSNPWALATMNIVGQQTGQRFQVRIWLWSRSFVFQAYTEREREEERSGRGGR